MSVIFICRLVRLRLAGFFLLGLTFFALGVFGSVEAVHAGFNTLADPDQRCLGSDSNCFFSRLSFARLELRKDEVHRLTKHRLPDSNAEAGVGITSELL